MINSKNNTIAIVPLLFLILLQTCKLYAKSPTREYYIQIAAYQNKNYAQNTLMHLHAKYPVFIRKEKSKGKNYYQVHIGPYSHFSQSKRVWKQLRNEHYSGYIRSYYVNAQQISKIVPTPSSKSMLHINKTPLPVKTTLKARSDPLHYFSIPPSSFQLIDRNTSLPVETPTNVSPYFRSRYPLRSLAQGTLGEQTNFFDGDIMFPIIGNSEWIGYIDGGGKYGQDTAWYGSIGSGLRNIRQNKLWGVYIFVDHNESINNQPFWVINPGVEAMSIHWDARINGYIPTSPRKSLGVFQGNQLGIDVPYYSRHALYSNLYNILDVTGPGIDSEIGYTMPQANYARPFVGGYYFNLSKGPSITGVEGGVELPVSTFISVILHDAYDSVQHNTAMATLRVKLGGVAKYVVPDIHNRILDPIQRHLGAFQTGAGIPIVKVTRAKGRTILQNNIWFFNPGGQAFIDAQGFQNCTYEHPCGTISQDTINGIQELAQNALFFINSGVYNNPTPGAGFTLYNGQSFYGRQDYFATSAQGSSRPQLNDTLFLNGNNAIESLQINGNSLSSNGFDAMTGVSVNASATGYVYLSNNLINTEISSSMPDANVVGVRVLSNNVDVQIDNNTITAHTFNNHLVGDVFGISNEGNSSIGIHNSVINATVDNNIVGANLSVTGIKNSGAGSISLTESIVNANAISTAGGNEGDSFGIDHQGSGSFIVSRSIINSNSLNNGSGAQNFGIRNAGSGELLINNSLITANTEGSGSATTAGVRAVGTGSTSIVESLIAAMATNGDGLNDIIGVGQSSGVVSILRSIIIAQGSNNSGNVFGINDNAGGNLTVTDTVITALSQNSGGTTEGILITNGNPHVSLNNIEVTATSDTGDAFGVLLATGILDYSNSSIQASSTNGGFVVSVVDSGTITHNTNNMCTENGLPVTCPS